MSRPSISPATKASLIQRIGTSVSSAEEEASRLFKIAQQTYDHLESKGLFRPHGWDLHSVGDTVVAHFKKQLQIEEHDTRGPDGQFIEVPMVDHGSSRIPAPNDNATVHELQNFTRDELDEILQEYQDGTESLLKEEEALERERQKEEERGRRSFRSGSEPDLKALAKALNALTEGVNEFHNSWVSPEEVDCSLERHVPRKDRDSGTGQHGLAA